jgi:hypothetical protein
MAGEQGHTVFPSTQINCIIITCNVSAMNSKTLRGNGPTSWGIPAGEREIILPIKGKVPAREQEYQQQSWK